MPSDPHAPAPNDPLVQRRDQHAGPGRLKIAAAATASGLRRYPRDLAESIRDVARARTDGDTAPPDLRGLHEHELAAAWLGHASVLLRQGGVTLLVDPVFSRRIGPRLGPLTLGPARRSCPVDPAALPPIDAILITHAHYDHLDRPTLAALASSRTIVITARGTRRLIPRGFRHVVELDWDDEREVERLGIRAIRPAHWGARAWLDFGRGFNSYVIVSDARRTIAAGDTARTDAFRGVGPIDLAVFGIGAYDPWQHKHATPEQVWEMFTAAPGARLLPVHHSTFELSDEHRDEPMRRLLAAAGEDRSRIIVIEPGDLWAASDDQPVPDRLRNC